MSNQLSTKDQARSSVFGNSLEQPALNEAGRDNNKQTNNSTCNKNKPMKKLAMLLALGATMALVPSVSKATGIIGTHHDFGRNNTYWTYGKTTNWVFSTREGASASSTNVCGACHVMHQGDPSQGPLWVHKPSSATVSTFYSSETYDILNLGTPTLGSSSKACLSCHDGTVGINEQVKMPDDGVNTVGTPTDTTKTNSLGVAMGSIKLTRHVITLAGGTDLSHTHPVGINYDTAAGNVQTLSGIAEFNDKLTDFPGTSLAVKAQLKGASNDKLECTTCHDIHAVRGDAPYNDKLTVASGHNLCLGCHIK